MDFFEKTISNLIEQQFPDVYRENGPEFIELVKAYYEWMEEEGNTLFHSRRLLDYRDIDSTVDSFLGHFKNKYLNGFQFNTASSPKNMVKHSLDLYRSKGTPRSIDLFFRNVFGVPATVYFPEKDIFKASSGKWVVPQYLEIEYSDDAKDFIGKEIRGIDSGATAFVETYVKSRSKMNGKPIHIYYISNRVGRFNSGEAIQLVSTKQIGPAILGSMNSINVVSGGTGYEVGELLNIRSDKSGFGGQALVANVGVVTGSVKFTMLDGGWGYNSNSSVIVSENVLTLNDITSIDGSKSIFNLFETIVQPMANIGYSSRSGQTFNPGDYVYTKDSSNTQVESIGLIMDSSATNTTDGYIRIAIVNGSFSSTPNIKSDSYDWDIVDENGISISMDEGITPNSFIYKFEAASNTSSPMTQATITFYSDQSASANIMGISDTLNLNVSDSQIKFLKGDSVYQLNTSGTEIANATVIAASNTSITVGSIDGSFLKYHPIKARNSTANSEILNISALVGVHNSFGSFFSSANSTVYGVSSQTSAKLIRISKGFGANVMISPSLLHTEINSLNTDYIIDHAATMLNSPDYKFPVAGVENANTIITNALTYDTDPRGSLTSIITTNPGINYDSPPFITVYDELITKTGKRDFLVTVSNASDFSIGELIVNNGNVIGKLKSISNNVLSIGRMTLKEISANYVISGEQSGASRSVISVDIDQKSKPVGLSAVIIANSSIAVGSVTELKIIDSGFAYTPGELIEFYREGDINFGEGTVIADTSGFSKGYHRNNNSVLSGNKYLTDGDYYQSFSYEVNTSIPRNKYYDMLVGTIHLAGTKLFSNFVSESTVEGSANITANIEIPNTGGPSMEFDDKQNSQYITLI